jgi:putative ABC transport system permease protein
MKRDDIDRELESHLEFAIDDLMRSGMSRDEARRRAIASLGGITQAAENYREAQRLPFVETTMQDLKFAWRLLWKSPGHTLAAILILGLGIGANTAIFTIVNAVVLRPLPFPESSAIMRVWQTPPPTIPSAPNGRRIFVVSPANFLDWQAQNRSFEKMALYGIRRLNLTGRGEPQALRTAIVTEDFFSILGVRAVAGRTLGPTDSTPGAARAVMISESLWQTHFGADPSVVGQTISLSGQPYVVAGVVPRRTSLPENTDLWTPIVWTPQERAVRSNHTYLVITRVKSGVSVDTAQADMTTISQRLERQYPQDDKGWGAVVLPLHEDMVGDVSRSLFVLLGAVIFVALIGSANLANLLLAKTLGRSKEIAVRVALGASRRRIIRQVLTETLLLAAGGGAIGLAIGRVGVTAISQSIGQRLPRVSEIAIDGRVLAFTSIVAIGAALLAGIVPAWRLTRGDPAGALKLGLGRSSGRSGERRVRDALVVCEVALAIVLLTGAGLLLRTLGQLRSVDAGFDPHNVLTMTVTIPTVPRGMPTPELLAMRKVFVDEVFRRVHALPGVEAMGATDTLPLQGGSNLPIAVEGRPSLPISEQPIVQGRFIGPGFLQATRMRLVAGREFDAWDAEHPQSSVLVSETMARLYWPGENPLGKRVAFTLISPTPRTIVGVVNDVKLTGLDVRDPVAAAYMPVDDWIALPPGFFSLAIRTTTPPEHLSQTIVNTIHGINALVPVRDVITMDEIVDRSVGSQRLAMMLISAFAALAMLLASIGIYSVLSYSVSQRMSEIGIRRALGASAATVMRTIVGEGLKPAAIGIALGLTVAALLGRVMTALLFGVGPHDPATFVGVSFVVVVVAIAATLTPAYRATRVDPMSALRAE